MFDDDSVTHEPAQWGEKVLSCDKIHDQSKGCSQMTHAAKMLLCIIAESQLKKTFLFFGEEGNKYFLLNKCTITILSSL